MSANEGRPMNMTENRKEEKFISLYQAFVDEIYRYVFLRTGLDTALAEDMTQEVFLDVFKGLNGFKGLCSDRTWVYKIAKNKLCDFYRKQYSQEVELIDIDDPLTECLGDPGQDMEKLVEAALESKIVRECLDRIPGHYRIVLMLKYIDDKSVKQIAELVARSPKAVESLLQRSKNVFIREYRLFREKEGISL